jgi:hypothetical protein
MAASKKLFQSFKLEGFTFIEIGDMEIWDGADLSLLREALFRLVVSGKRRKIGVDMRYVKYIPSGFFGMLFDWREQGIRVQLFSPQDNVRRMLWFHRFFVNAAGERFELVPDAPQADPARYLPDLTQVNEWQVDDPQDDAIMVEQNS